MVVVKRRQYIDKEQILSKISQYDIYRFYLGEFRINKLFCNPLRGENNPSFRVIEHNGDLHHMDFAFDSYSGDCFDLVCQKFGCDLKKALHIIDADFKLGFSKENTGASPIKWERPKILTKKENLIQVVVKKYTQEELDYWKQYLITEDDLLRDGTFSPREIYYNRKKWPMDEKLRFCYRYGDKWKTYTPYAEDRSKKWAPNNVPITTIDGEIYECEKLIITKARKCYQVLKNVFPCVIAVQNESLSAFSNETIRKIRETCKEVYLWYDNDVAGKRASIEVTQQLGFKHLNNPDRLLDLGVKDPSDWVKHEQSHRGIYEFLKSKNIIQ